MRVISDLCCAKCPAKATHLMPARYCDKHARFMQMRRAAKTNGKAVPTDQQLESLAAELVDMKCPCCGAEMNWVGEPVATRVTLQHDRDGVTVRLICKSCNSRHRFMPGDSFYQLKPGYKFCPRCEDVKPISEFPKDATQPRTGRASFCNPCKRISRNASYHRRKART